MIDILLVEDDKEICFILTELLKRNHYNVSAYHNGIEAIEALSSKKYDLMLLDLMLPDLPGEKILLKIKKHNKLRDLGPSFFVWFCIILRLLSIKTKQHRRKIWQVKTKKL